jgi:hypothetical protein
VFYFSPFCYWQNLRIRDIFGFNVYLSVHNSTPQTAYYCVGGLKTEEEVAFASIHVTKEGEQSILQH